MSDVPDGMVTDARELYRGDLVYRKDHNAEVLLLRKQIWQLMGDVADAREDAVWAEQRGINRGIDAVLGR